MALERFREEDGEELSVFISAVAGEGCPTDVAEVVYCAVTGGNSNGRSLTRIRTELACDIELSIGLTLIVDEAHTLEPDGAEWLRGLVEQAGCTLVLAGDLALLNLRTKLPQLARRVPHPVVIERVTAEDVAALMQGTPFAAPEAIKLLTLQARRIGGLLDVQLVLDDAFDIAQAADEPPTMVHLKFALDDYAQARKRMEMTDDPNRKLCVTAIITPAELEESRAAATALMQFPTGMAGIANMLDTIGRDHPEAAGDLTKASKVLRVGSRFAHGLSAYLNRVFSTATVSDPEGGVQ